MTGEGLGEAADRVEGSRPGRRGVDRGKAGLRRLVELRADALLSRAAGS